MSTKPVRVSTKSPLMRCAFLLQAAAIAACASNPDAGADGQSQTTGPATMTPSQSTAGAPAAAMAGSSASPAQAGSTAAPSTPAAGGPAAAAAGSMSASMTGTAGSSAAGTMAMAGAAGSSAAAAGASGEAGSTGGAAGGGATGAGGATFTAVFDAMFASSAAAGCGSCHGAAPTPSLNGGLGGLMTKEAAYSALVGKMSSSAMCSGMPYVTAGDPEASLLYQKVATTPMCGMRMPPGSMVEAADQELLKTWIMAGAKDD